MRALALLCFLAVACGHDDGATDAGAQACTEAEALAAASQSGLDRCDGTCRRPGGFICAYGTGMDRCASDDGFNECDCYGKDWACTLVGVADGGLATIDRPAGAPPFPGCRDQADCPPVGGRGVCVFDPDPRETLGRCNYYRAAP